MIDCTFAEQVPERWSPGTCPSQSREVETDRGSSLCSARDEGSLRIVGRVGFRKPVLAHLQAISDRTAAFTRATMIEYDDPYRAAY